MEPTQIRVGEGIVGLKQTDFVYGSVKPFDNEWPRWVMLLNEAFVTLNLDAMQR